MKNNWITDRELAKKRYNTIKNIDLSKWTEAISLEDLWISK
jgi:hypothetical protein